MKADVLRHRLCDASGASQPAGIVNALGRNSSAHVVRFIRFGVASFVVCVRRLESSILCVRFPAPAQRRCLACCFRARAAALFSLLFSHDACGRQTGKDERICVFIFREFR